MNSLIKTPLIAAMLAATSLAAADVAFAQGAPGGVVTAAPSATPAADSDETTIRCRRLEVTGSLVRKERVCKTVAEWRRLSDRGNDNARDTMDRVGQICAGTCGGG